MTDANRQRGLPGLIERARRFLERELWDIELAGLPTLRAVGVRATRVLSLAWQGMVQSDGMTRASALTYISVLSLVPLLAFAFSVAKGFGAYEYLVEQVIDPALDQLAPPIADGAAGGGEATIQLRDAAEDVLDFVARTNFANLGLVGLTILMFTSLKLMTQIESTFNVIWGVQRARTLVRKLADFIALVVVTPILMLVATTLTAAARNNALTTWLTETVGLGPMVRFLFGLIPLATLALGFCFLFMIMPNTRVHFRSAAVGGFVAGALWQGNQILHVTFQIGVARYNAIYSGFAAIPIFLVWVYLSWVVVLVGAVVAWAHQAEPAYREHKRLGTVSLADRELVALQALSMIGRSFLAGSGAVTVGAVAAHCNLSPSALQQILEPLAASGLIAGTDEPEGQGLLPARPLDEMRITDVLRAIRGERREEFEGIDDVDGALERMRAATESSPLNLTLRELIDRPAG